MFGELISLFVALSWTVTALFAEVGSKRMGSLPFNTVRMTMSLLFLALTLWIVMGAPYPRFADGTLISLPLMYSMPFLHLKPVFGSSSLITLYKKMLLWGLKLNVQ